MNAIELALSEDLARLMDRLASSLPEGAVEQFRGGARETRARLDQVEVTLAAARASLLENYARWTRALDDVENLWAVAALRSSAEDPEPRATRLAA